jgi:hypothetical protein
VAAFTDRARLDPPISPYKSSQTVVRDGLVRSVDRFDLTPGDGRPLGEGLFGLVNLHTTLHVVGRTQR